LGTRRKRKRGVSGAGRGQEYEVMDSKKFYPQEQNRKGLVAKDKRRVVRVWKARNRFFKKSDNKRMEMAT